MQYRKFNFFISLAFFIILACTTLAATAYNLITITSLPSNNFFNALSANNSDESMPSKKYSVGVVVPQGFLAEQEASKRLCIAANKMNWPCYIMSYNWQHLKDSEVVTKIYRFIWDKFTSIMGVDFIIELQPAYTRVSPLGKVTTFLAISQNMSATLGDISVTFDLGEAGYKERQIQNLDNYNENFWRYIGDYDGFIDAGFRYGWLRKFNLAMYTSSQNQMGSEIKPILEGFNSVYATNFIPLEYKELFYCGDNLDPLRGSAKYKLILTELAKLNYLNVYGPEASWTFIPTAYKGFIPSDGYSLIRTMQDSGISLILHSKNNLRDGIPSTRIFEAAAASTVIISDQNKFIKQEFGDCVLYIDVKKPAEDVVHQIDAHVKWIKNNPAKAKALAKCAHKKFNANFQLELLLQAVASSTEELKVLRAQKPESMPESTPEQ